MTTAIYRLPSWAPATGFRIDSPAADTWTWVWLEDGKVASSTDQTWPDPVDALRAAADEARATFTGLDEGDHIARRLRLAAAAIERSRATSEGGATA